MFLELNFVIMFLSQQVKVMISYNTRKKEVSVKFEVLSFPSRVILYLLVML